MVATSVRLTLLVLIAASCKGREGATVSQTQPPVETVPIAGLSETRAILELNGRVILVGGVATNADKLEGAIFRLDGELSIEKVFSSKRRVVSLVEGGGLIWAGVSNGYQDQWLSWSVDQGGTWAEPVPVPTNGLWAAQATHTRVWAYDLNKLVRSNDRGVSWQTVTPAKTITLDSRFRGHNQSFCQYGDGYWCTVDGGSSWEKPYGDVVIVAIDSSHTFAIKRRGESFQLVTLGEHLVPMGVEFDAHAVRDIHVHGSNVAVLAAPAPTSLENSMRGWVYLSSINSGKTWRRQRLPARTGSVPDEPPADMARTQEIVAIPGGVGIGLVQRLSR